MKNRALSFILENFITSLEAPSAISSDTILVSTHATHIVKGYTDMQQYHFSNKDQATIFLKKIQAHPDLKKLDIHKAGIKEEKCKLSNKTCCIVRLTEAQYNALKIAQADSNKMKQTIAPDHKTRPVSLVTNILQIITNTLSSKENKIEFLPFFPHHIKLSESNTIVKLHYRDSSAVKKVSDYLKQQSHLKEVESDLDIYNTNCIHHDDMKCLIVSLTPKQFNTLCNDDTAFSILSEIYIKNEINYFSALFSLLESASAKLLNIALILQDNMGSCPLHLAAHYQDSTAFQALIAKVSPEAINQALSLQNKSGWCPLHLAAQYQDSTAFQALITKASPGAIDKALVLQEQDGWCLLNMAVCFPNSIAFQALITKASPGAIDKALVLQTKNGYCTLMNASMHQDTEGFIQLVNKASPNALCEAFTKEADDGESTIFVAAQYQSHQSMHALLQRLKSPVDALNDYFFIYSSKFFAVLQRFSLYQSGENIIAFLSLLDDALLSKMAKELPNHVNNPSVFPALLAFNLKIDAVLIRQSGREEKKSDFSPAPAPFLEHVSLWKKPILEKLNHLKSENKKVIDNKPNYIQEEEILLRCFKEGKAVVKVLRDDKGTKNWDDFLIHLLDYTKRQDIRTPKKLETGHDTGYKFVHIPTDVKNDKKEPGVIYFPKGKIIPFDLKKQQAAKKDKKYTGTIKTPLTLISSYLNTGLFGAGDAKRELVGLVFHSDLIHYKMMLTQDRGTFYRNWVNSDLNKVSSYAHNIQHISHTNWMEYKKAIDDQPYAINEALGEVNRYAILGIFIGKETPEAIDIALRRQKELELTLKRKVPIIFYNPILQDVRIFTDRDQLLYKTKKTIKDLTSTQIRHFTFQAAVNQLTGKTTEQLQELYSLIDVYLKSPSNKSFIRNDHFYKALQRLCTNPIFYHNEVFTSKKTLSS
jgi:hypothetical protein